MLSKPKLHYLKHCVTWLDDEIVADSWLDAYQVIRDSDHLNQGLDYLMSALTFDNETVKLGETLSKDLYGKEINASVSRFEGYQQCPFKHYASRRRFSN